MLKVLTDDQSAVFVFSFSMGPARQTPRKKVILEGLPPLRITYSGVSGGGGRPPGRNQKYDFCFLV